MHDATNLDPYLWNGPVVDKITLALDVKLSKAFSTASILGSIVTIDSLFFSERSDISLTLGLFSCTSAEICSVSVLIGNSDTLLIASFICWKTFFKSSATRARKYSPLVCWEIDWINWKSAASVNAIPKTLSHYLQHQLTTHLASI